MSKKKCGDIFHYQRWCLNFEVPLPSLWADFSTVVRNHLELLEKVNVRIVWFLFRYIMAIEKVPVNVENDILIKKYISGYLDLVHNSISKRCLF